MTSHEADQALHVALLGPIEATRGGASIDLGGGRQRAVFAALALQPNRVVSTEMLVDAVWGDDPPASAKSTLQAYVSRLRKVIEGAGDVAIEGSSVGYVFRLDVAAIDREQFTQLVEDGRRAMATGAAAVAAERLAEALSSWRGDPLADLAGYAFADAERAILERDRLAVTGEWIDARLACGQHDAAVPVLEQLVVRWPFHEPFWRQLMVALYRADRQADALDAYQSGRAVLLEELGIEPGPALVATETAILQQDPALLLQPVAPLTAQPRSSAEIAARRDGLIGREREYASLTDQLSALAEGGGLAVVSGPAGIGKTALLYAVADAARAVDTPVFWGRAWEGGEAPAFWPWVEVLRQWAAVLGDDAVRALAGGRIDTLARLLPEFSTEESSGGVEPSHAQFSLYEAVAGVLAQSAETMPFVIVIDDLQWADVSSIELLKFLAARLKQSRVLVVVGRRNPAATSRATTMALRGLDVAPHDLRLELGPLDAAATEVLVRRSAPALAGDDDSGAVAAIVARSEGLPFYAVELARGLDIGGAGATMALPSSLRETLVRRLDQLDDDARELLRFGAVAGEEFSLATVGRAIDQQGVALLVALEASIDAGVLRPVSGRSDRYRFAHALVREALVDALGHVERISCHARLADALAASAVPATDELVVERAHHALEAAAAVPTLGAVDLAEEASMRALRSFGYEEAVRWLDRAAPVVSACGDNHRACELLLRRGSIENRAGWAERAKETHLDAAALARTMQSGPHLARAADGHAYTRMDVQVVDEVHLGLCAEADDLLDPGDSGERAMLLASWGNAHYWGDASVGRGLVDDGVAMARRVGDARVLGGCLRAAAWLAYGDGAARIDLGREMLEIARRTRDVELQLWGRRWVHVGTFDVEGPSATCRATLESYVRHADEARQPHHLWFGALFLANFALMEGHMSEAERLIDEAFAVGQVAEPITATQYYGAQMFALRWLQGRMDELIPLAEVTVAQYPEVHTWRALLAYLYSATDQPDKARQRLVEIEATGWDDITSGGTLIMAHGLAAEAAVRSGCADIGEVLLPRIADHGDHYVHMAFVVTMGSARFFHGRLRGLLGDIEGAIVELEAAEVADEQRRLAPMLVRDRLVLAELLEKRGEDGDAGRADELRTAAEASATEMGMRGLGYL